jgi:dTDP-4-amino-4,6-dideoxygalactose transaminase
VPSKQKNELIRYIRPLLPPLHEWSAFLDASYASRYFANRGPAVRLFEESLQAKYARGRAVVSGPNATATLVCALQALGVQGPVLTPSLTFAATPQAVRMAGCTPTFCDIDPDTWELDAAAAEKILEQGGIQAILHVRAYGFGHDLVRLEALAREHRIPLIVDAAAALGGRASIEGQVGQQGDVEVFSLHATKVFAIGEGGAAFTRPELAEAFRQASNFGIRQADVVVPGLNGKLADFQAAVGLAVLERIDTYIEQRRRVAAFYHGTLSAQPRLRHAPPPDLAPWQSYPLLLSPAMDIAALVERALGLGLELKRGYHLAMHQTGYFRRFTATPLPVTEDISAHTLCLPVYSDMSLELAARVMELFLAAVDR